MITKGGKSPGWSAESQARWRTAGELLEAGHYEQVIEFLHEAQVACEGAGDAILAHTLDAARRICLACSQYRDEVAWHEQARGQADQREHESRQQLHTILDLISERGALETQKKQKGLLDTPTVETSPPGRGLPSLRERPSLGQRIWALLGREPSLRSPVQEPPIASVEGPALLSTEKAETPAVPLLMPEREASTVAPVEKEKQREQTRPLLVVYCLGPFRVYQDDQPVKDWPSSKGKAIFKYLFTHRKHPVVKEVLMELFWPGVRPDAARNNLNVAIYGLRQALRRDRPSYSHVLFQDDCYLPNPDLEIWVDCEAFMEHYAAAQDLERREELAAAMREYRVAEALYQGEFMEEDRYEDWPTRQRKRLRDDYLSLLDRLSRYYFEQGDCAACVTACDKMLTVDTCCEEAHRRLMRCYCRQGQPYLALRQYHLCVERLRDELDAFPSQEITDFYEQIRSRGTA